MKWMNDKQINWIKSINQWINKQINYVYMYKSLNSNIITNHFSIIGYYENASKIFFKNLQLNHLNLF